MRNPVDYALFICFFPQLVAGPIVRARDFFRDLWAWQPPSSDDVSRGVFLIALGLTKKMAFADQFAKVANGYFGNVAAHPGALAAWSGVFAFALQIYFDFSGYTDMAIGMAKLFGFHFPINFRRPYLAASITDFWRRWHISLSSWLRDYLYIPLGGSRGGRWRTYRNLMLTMLLGGLWHGASWNFLIWGGYHGGAAGHRAGDARRAGRRARSGIGRYPLRAVLTFVLALIGWVFFRAADLRQSVQVLGQMFGGSGGQRAAGALAFRPGGAGPDSVGRGGEVGVVRARRPGAAAGLRVGAGRDAVLPGNLRRFGRGHSVHLLPVLAADGRRGLHHGKQQTNHHEDCETRSDDHKLYPTCLLG